MSLIEPAMRAAAGADTQWYGCPSDLGSLYVGVVVGESALGAIGGPLQTLRQAALLAEVELVLQAFEIWQHVELDLQPLNRPPDSGSAGDGSIDIGSADINAPNIDSADCNGLQGVSLTGDSPASFADVAAHGRSPPAPLIELQLRHKSMANYLPVRVQLPASAAQRLQPVSEELQRCLDLRWSPVQALLEIDRFSLGEAELQKLEQGAMVLLPRSFQQSWPANLLFPEIDHCGIDGCLQAAAAVFVFDGTTAPDIVNEGWHSASDTSAQGGGEAAPPLSVRLQQSLTLSAQSLLKGGSSAPLALPAGALAAELLYGDQAIARGALGAVGSGYALYIDGVSTRQLADIH